MGLFDFDLEDPKKMGLLMMAAQMMGGAPGGRKNFGADLSSGIQAGLLGYQNAKMQQAKLAEEAQQKELRGYQLQSARQGVEDESAYRGAMTSAPDVSRPSLPNMAPTNANAAALAAMPKPSPYDQASKMVEYLRGKGVHEKYLKPYVEQMEKMKPKFKADQQLVKVDGKLMLANMADDGSMTLAPYTPAEKMKDVNLGGSVGMVGEYTGNMGQQYKASMAPGEFARLAQGDRHFNEEMGFKREQADQGKIPSGYAPDGRGGLRFIPGGPADPSAGKPTDTERMASGYYDRMAAAEKVMSPIEKTAGKPGVREAVMMTIPGVGEMAANSMPQIMGGRSPERQSYRQAQEDWVRAKLRKESGAVISDPEMEREIRTYFPQVGDSPKVIEQKAKSRQTAAQAMRTSAGPVASPHVDDLLKKYLGNS